MLSAQRAPYLNTPRRVSGGPTIRSVPRSIGVSSLRTAPVLRAERGEGSESSSFVSGFVLGGVLFGALGFLFAPQISKALIGDDQRLKLPRFMEEEAKDPAQTKQELIDKIASLNASIDEVSAKLNSNEPQVASQAASLTNDLKKMFQL